MTGTIGHKMTGASPWMRRIEWWGRGVSAEGVGGLHVFIRWLMLRGIVSLRGDPCCQAERSRESRNATSAALPLFLLSQVNPHVRWGHVTRPCLHRGVFSKSLRNAGWNVDTTRAVCAAAEQKRFANFGANTPYPFPFIVPFATD